MQARSQGIARSSSFARVSDASRRVFLLFPVSPASALPKLTRPISQALGALSFAACMPSARSEQRLSQLQITLAVVHESRLTPT